jgi:hypothetical protein
MSRTPPTKGGDFKPCPEGTWNAILCDVTEPFEITLVWQGKARKEWARMLVWQVSKEMENGLRFIARQRYTDSQHPKSNLRPVITALLGRKLTNDEEAFGVELDELVNRPCMITVEHNKKIVDGQERVYANVTNVVALPEGMPPLEFDNGWTRWKDRDADKIPDWYRDLKWKPQEQIDPNRTADEAFTGPGPDDFIPF